VYALRTLKAHGMDDPALQTIYRSVIIAKLTNASSAWWGYRRLAGIGSQTHCRSRLLVGLHQCYWSKENRRIHPTKSAKSTRTTKPSAVRRIVSCSRR